VPAQAESPALVRTDEAEVEKRLLVRFAPFTALRERRVMPREVSIVLVGDDSKRLRLRRKGVGFGNEFGTGVAYSDSDTTPTMLGRARSCWIACLQLHRRARTSVNMPL